MQKHTKTLYKWILLKSLYSRDNILTRATPLLIITYNYLADEQFLLLQLLIFVYPLARVTSDFCLIIEAWPCEQVAKVVVCDMPCTFNTTN